MSSIIDVADETAFASHITALPSSALAVIAFQTPWAAPCKQMRLILETIASSYAPQTPSTISFLNLDAEALPDISESYNVTAVPFLVLQRGGKVIESVSGSDPSKLRDAVQRHAGASGNIGKFGLPPALETSPVENDNDTQQPTNKSQKLSYVPSANDISTASEFSAGESGREDLNKRLAELVEAAPVMLFMKGTPSMPQCGFSRQLVSLLREQGVRYGFFNILADEDVRQGLKALSDWPTFPQLYLQGDLIGGLDIVKEELDSNPEFFSRFQARPKDEEVKAAPKS